MSAATFVTAQLMRALPRARISHIVGDLAKAPLAPLVARMVVGAYTRAYHVDLSDAAARTVPGLRVLFTSGYAHREAPHLSVSGENARFIEKPFTSVGLTTKVRECLDGLCAAPSGNPRIPERDAGIESSSPGD